ncbi:MAG: LysM peptidoglycan-binding domain-containing protein [Streptomycetaceae bacterium]|nr:LysM peptidoglycan-binding domain-containing protein [Streptomycetaceae bacterium]
MGKHRRPKRASKAFRFAGLAGVTGTAIAAPLVTATSASAATQSQWAAVAQCESGNNWSINTGNGFYGGLQFTSSTWAAYGGTQFAPQANQATQAQQIQIAEKVLASQGKGAWPVCGHGLTATPYNGSSSGSSSSGDSAPIHHKAHKTHHNTSSRTESTGLAPTDLVPTVPATSTPSASTTPSHAEDEDRGSYIVKPGDTLSGIAVAHHVSGGWQKLFELNRDIIKDPNLIYPGQHLCLG